MGRTKGSSSKRPHVEQEAIPENEEEDLTKTYEANFPILSHEEGAILTKIQFREILGCKYISNSLLNNLGMFDEIDKMLHQCGLKKFISMHEDTHVDLIIEFYTTLNVNASNSKILEFRLEGKKHQLTYAFMNRAFGFRKDGLCEPPSSFRLTEFWHYLTDLKTPFHTKKSKAMFIKDMKFWLLHKFLACVVFHRTEFNRVSAQELFLMWCIHNKKHVCWTYWIFN